MQQEWYQSSLFSILIILGPFRWSKYSNSKEKKLGKVRPELRPQFPAGYALRKCLTMPDIYLNSTDIYWHVVRIDNWNDSMSFNFRGSWILDATSHDRYMRPSTNRANRVPRGPPPPGCPGGPSRTWWAIQSMRRMRDMCERCDMHLTMCDVQRTAET